MTPHSPFTHTGLLSESIGQRMPQPPQFSTSLRMSRQRSPQRVRSSDSQTNSQRPPAQIGSARGGAVQVAPQRPQFCSSSSRITHLPLHTVSPSSQLPPVLLELSPAPPPLPKPILTQVLLRRSHSYPSRQRWFESHSRPSRLVETFEVQAEPRQNTVSVASARLTSKRNGRGSIKSSLAVTRSSRKRCKRR